MRNYPTCIDCKKPLFYYSSIRCRTCNGAKRRIPLNIRFWKYVKKTKTCWLWIGAHSHKGYGTIYNEKTHEKAHRISWIIHNGGIPQNKHVLHNCLPFPDNPLCVNPKHLWIGTHTENVQDMFNKRKQQKI